MFPLPRFEAVSRREFLARSAALGAAVLVGAGCSNDDRSKLGSETLPTTAANSAAPSTLAPTSTGAPATDAAATTSATTQPVASGDAFPAGAQLEVAFTYSGQGRNPYIAVWVETPEGDIVQTISLWLQINKSRYLDHLKRWYNAETNLLDAGGTNNLDAIAGASRPAGDYQVVWDGTDVEGNPVAQGDYVLCIEAAREHGPYELVSGPITIGTTGFQATLDDNGELSAVEVTFVV